MQKVDISELKSGDKIMWSTKGLAPAPIQAYQWMGIWLGPDAIPRFNCVIEYKDDRNLSFYFCDPERNDIFKI